MMRGIPGLTIVDPCDALDIEQAVPQIAAHQGPVYMRLPRGNVPLVLDEYDYKFELGKAKLLRDGKDVLVISSGFMTMRALEVAEQLRADSVDVAVLHVPTIKPLDEATILAEVKRLDRAGGGRREPFGDRRPGRGGREPAAAQRRGADVPADGAARRLPRRRRAADTARSLRHFDERDGSTHTLLALSAARWRALTPRCMPQARRPGPPGIWRRFIAVTSQAERNRRPCSSPS